MTEKQLSEERVRSLKLQVLNEHRDFLCRELGDPARYLPYLRSKRVLDDNSAERIKSKTTTSEKVDELVDTLNQCGDSYDGHPLDVLIEGIKRQKVQLHISRVLLKAVNKLIKDQTPGVLQDTPVGGSTSLSVAALNGPAGNRSDRSSQDPVGSNEIQLSGHDSYETHPEYGPLPNPPPRALKMEGNTTASNHDNNDDVHPEYGPLPGAPPITIQHSDGSSESITSLGQQQLDSPPTLGPLSCCSNSTPTYPYSIPTSSKGGRGGQEAGTYTGYGDDSEYYRAQLDQKDADIRNLQSKLKDAQNENGKLKARIDVLERELTAARQGRGGGATSVARPSNLPFSRSPDHNPGHCASSLGTPRAMALTVARSSDERSPRHDRRAFTPGRRTSPHNNMANASVATPMLNAVVTTPMPVPAGQPSSAVTLTPTGNECTTDV